MKRAAAGIVTACPANPEGVPEAVTWMEAKHTDKPSAALKMRALWGFGAFMFGFSVPMVAANERGLVIESCPRLRCRPRSFKLTANVFSKLECHMAGTSRTFRSIDNQSPGLCGTLTTGNTRFMKES
jgi:hypothetical protein